MPPPLVRFAVLAVLALGASQQPPAQEPPKGGRRIVPVEEGVAEPDQLLEWFQIADYSENGWISFREASQSFSFDRERWEIYDIDRDGRLRFNEFELYYRDCMEIGGGFKPPVPSTGPGTPPRRSPARFMNAYDTDLDRFLNRTEIAAMLVDYGQEDKPADKLLELLDEDHDEKLAVDELRGLMVQLYGAPDLLTDATAGPEQKGRAPRTPDELFGAVIRRDSSLSPPRIVGPVSHFRRLDLDGDGAIELSDLEELLRPVQISVRIPTVLNTLDLDGDGTLSEVEFLRALDDPRR